MAQPLDLSFRFDEETFALYASFRPERVEFEELVTLFYFPFRLLVGDAELFWAPPAYDEEDSYLPALPLIGTVLDLQTATLALTADGEQALQLPNHGSLVLVRKGSQLTLGASMTGLEATVRWADWQAAVVALVEETQELFLRRIPELEKHPRLGPWLKTGTLPPDPLTHPEA